MCTCKNKVRQYDEIRDFKNGRGAGFKKPLPLVAIAVFVVAINVLFFLILSSLSL